MQAARLLPKQTQIMLIKIFTIPILGGEAANADMIAFMRSHKIVNVDKKFCQTPDGVYWCFCLNYLDAAATQPGQKEKEKVDYQSVLDEKVYARFVRLREIRKQVADKEKVFAYVVFTDAELAEIAKLDHITEPNLLAIKGIGKGKVEKYGKFFYESDSDLNSANGAESPSRVRERLFKDKALLKIFSKIIASYSVEQGRDLPIGNLTSQYFANYYLSDLDHYIKQTLRVKYYIRYMDDMLIFGDSFSHLREIFADLTRYITDLHLDFKPPIYTTSVRGVGFLGYKIYRHKMLLDARSKHRFAKKLALYAQNFAHDIWTEKEYQKHLIPLFAFARHAYSKQFRAATIQRFEDRRAPTTSCAAVVAVRPLPIAVSRVATTTTGTTTTTHRGISVSVLSSAHSLLKRKD